MNEDMSNFVQKLDELLEKYNELISVNYDQEFLRLLKLQQTESKEKIAAMEAKLKIAKNRLKFETSARKRAEAEREKLAEIIRKSNKSLSSVATSDFQTPNNSHLISGEEDLSLSIPNELRKHRTANNTCVSVCVSKVDANTSVKKNTFRLNTRNYPKSPEFSYLGVAKLDNYINRMNSTSFIAHEPFSVTLNSISQTPLRAAAVVAPDTSDGVKLNKTFKLVDSRNSLCSTSLLKQESTPVTRRCADSNISIAKSKNSDEYSISQFAPLIPPMIPSVVIHCIDEVEKRGLKEIGIYRMPGGEEEMNILAEKFESCDTSVNLSDFNIHSIAAFLKSFLRHHPLIPKAFHLTFAQIACENDRDELYHAISLLPQANRDTLAYLVVHLRKIALSIVCRMPSSRVASIFAPIIFGLHLCDKENEILGDQFITVVEEFLRLASSYWGSFIVEPSRAETPSKLRNSPSTEQIVRTKAKKYFTPPGQRRKRFFTSPMFE